MKRRYTDESLPSCFGGMSVPDAKRPRELEAENAKLKKVSAEAMLDAGALRVVARGKLDWGQVTGRST